MGQKDEIINLLKINGAMTQGSLAESMYGDKYHSSNIYASLIGLVNKKIVIRTGSNPSYYHLPAVEVVISNKQVESKKGYRDVSGDLITNDTIEDAAALVKTQITTG